MHMLYDKSFGIPRLMRDVSYVMVLILRILNFAADPRNFAVRCCCWKPTVKN